VQEGHFKRNTLRDGVFVVPWNIGDVVRVVSTGGAVTIVSLWNDGGSAGCWRVTAVTVASAVSFIFALDLVGGMYKKIPELKKARVTSHTMPLAGRIRIGVSPSGVSAVFLTLTDMIDQVFREQERRLVRL
jgi:hypothetical protein